MAEIKNMDAVAALDAMDAHVDDWRDATKGKQRGIFSFDDVAALKIKNLKKRIYTDIESIPAWKMKEWAMSQGKWTTSKGWKRKKKSLLSLESLVRISALLMS